jgi:elongation factor Ts
MERELLEKIKQLRAETGAPIGKCKEALLATGGDLEKAKEWLRRKGSELLSKKEAVETGQGIIEGYVHFNGRVGALVELRAETDFVTKSEDFKKLAHEIALQIATMNPQYISLNDVPVEVLEAKKREFIEEIGEDKPKDVIEKILQGKLEKWASEVCLLNQPYIKKEEITVKDLIDEYVNKFGEKIEIRRFVRLAID